MDEKNVLLTLDLQTESQKSSESLYIRNTTGIYNIFFKRLIDLVLSSFLIVMLLPLYFLISFFIAIESGFPVFYCADRGGFRKKTFKIIKFRSMVKNADKIGGGTTALNDSRITKVGAFLRKTKLDEIPQLFNVFVGSMSFIGPRPELLKYTNLYKNFEQYILEVRPGITDYSSIEFINLDEIVGSENADEMYEKYVLSTKNTLRLKYVANISFLTDLKLFFNTVLNVIKKIIKFVFKRKKNGA